MRGLMNLEPDAQAQPFGAIARADPGTPPVQRRLGWLPTYAWPGTVGAALLAASTFTPSLLPRTWYLQALVAAVAGAAGYGLGVLVAWFVRQFTDWRLSPAGQRRAWQLFAVVGGVGAALTAWAGWRWQVQITALMGEAPPPAYHTVGILLLGSAVFVGLVAICRVLRRFTHWVMRILRKIIPARATRPLAIVIVTLVVIGILNGVIFRAFVSVSNSIFGVKDGTTTSGTVQPTAEERSGSPASMIGWDSLGRKGRDFVAGGPTQAQITQFTGGPALEPIRIYAGLKSAPTVSDRVSLAIKDLQRAGGFNRKVLVVVTTTGTGWVDPAAVDTLEYMSGGDSAVVAMQYSYLPSWISFLVDKSKAQEAGAELFNGVYDAWSKLPQNSRPGLYVFGESLGTFGGEAAFSGVADIRNRTSGIVFAGPPNFNSLWTQLVTDRDPGSPEILPIYQQGATVRWAGTPADLANPSTVWNSPRMIYLQHSSDPIVWWSPSLLLHEPDWLAEPRGRDVSPQMRWFPWVTFWQVTADMAFSTGVPSGHGHVYQEEYVDAWAAVLQPPGWTSGDTTKLRDLMH